MSEGSRSWFDETTAPDVAVAGVVVEPRRKTLNFVSGATAVDNPTTQQTDITVAGGGGGGGGGSSVGSTPPQDIKKQAAAPGVSTEAARVDHLHQVSTGTPVAVTPGASASDGAATSLARSDHVHSLPAFGTSGGTFCQGNDSRLTDDRTASGIRTTQTVVAVSASASPLPGRSLVASSSVLAAWTDRPISRVTAVPSAGHWQLGDLLLWGGDSSRLALRAQRTGALGTVARANTTAYSENAVISSGTRLFAVAIAGTTAGSAPGALATAAFGDRITDGTALLECVGTTVQTPDFASLPNIDAPAVALADSSATVQITDGPVRECATATANRTTTLGTTGAVQGDVLTFRRVSNTPGAFTWTFDGTSGGGDSIQIPANTRGVVRFVLNAAGVWVVRDVTGTLT